MMRINNLNKFYIVIALGVIVFSIYRILEYNSWERYYYDATMTAPATYPIHVRECALLTGDDDDNAYVRHENVNNHISEWGDEGDFLELSDKMFLPKKLAISYFSYCGKHFYKDTIQMPTDKIKELFKQAIRNNNTEKYYSAYGNAKGLNFTIGIANDGQLLIWLRGINLEKLILKTKLKPTVPNQDDLYHGEPLSREKYFEYAFEGISDSLKSKIDNSCNANTNYADSATNYIQRNTKLWKYQKQHGFID
ncbi:MAG: DUF2931 family protein [Flavobacterium sp.]